LVTALADEHDGLVGHAQPGEIVIDTIKDVLRSGIEEQRVSRLRLGVERDEQRFLFRAQSNFSFLVVHLIPSKSSVTAWVV
jgi:hypothetical protein